MTDKKINKHELRTKETRELLLQSAETIFVRDGYEGAELGEIASLAGRTKGAIYAHFKSKEDIFLALIEQRTKGYRTQMAEMLARSTGTEENLEAFRQFYLRLTEDPAWALLFLEFKLFAIRHPESKEKLQRYFDEVIPGSREKELIGLLGSPGEGPDSLNRSVAIQALHPLLTALAVETRLMPNLLTDHTLKMVANRIFDALMLPPSRCDKDKMV
ncbi:MULTISPECIES: TetR/AcrR family transcriptional regulator [Acidobacteriaceae]|uniref:TetR/AcrR family transcriptional regulator n=1 Tax=Acidobacteriaceae TaxID=204434 RepID=UPI00131E9D3B|nr:MULTISPECIES: TetR/AcrR family transcriptional regulator [Acidobacteriaceae]MDW5265241.1 TetR/AcrR family transcriptional regulator [Edaphobacter sp.]